MLVGINLQISHVILKEFLTNSLLLFIPFLNKNSNIKIREYEILLCTREKVKNLKSCWFTCKLSRSNWTTLNDLQQGVIILFWCKLTIKGRGTFFEDSDQIVWHDYWHGKLVTKSSQFLKLVPYTLSCKLNCQHGGDKECFYFQGDKITCFSCSFWRVRPFESLHAFL